MNLDDPRLEWIRCKVNVALKVKNLGSFADLLERENGKYEQLMLRFVNYSTSETESTSLIFCNDYRMSENVIKVITGPEDAESEIKTMSPKDNLYVAVDSIPDVVTTIKTYCYFTRNSSAVIPTPSDIDEANLLMPGYLECGVIDDSPLHMIDQALTYVFKPLLAFGAHNTPSQISTKPSHQLVDEEDDDNGIQHEEFQNKVLMRDEFVVILNKFATSVQRTIYQLEGDIRLVIPHLFDEDEEIQDLARREGMFDELEDTCGYWQQQISTAIEQQLNKTPIGNGPLAEIDYWRKRSNALSALTEQLKLPIVLKMLDVLSLKNDTTALSNFQMSKDELNKYFIEAKDNVRFLTTLERHFKNLSHGTNFQTVVDTIPSMMNAMRMVWIISRKISYCCIPNMKSSINAHNHKILNNKNITTKDCNCN